MGLEMKDELCFSVGGGGRGEGESEIKQKGIYILFEEVIEI